MPAVGLDLGVLGPSIAGFPRAQGKRGGTGQPGDRRQAGRFCRRPLRFGVHAPRSVAAAPRLRIAKGFPLATRVPYICTIDYPSADATAQPTPGQCKTAAVARLPAVNVTLTSTLN